MAGLGMNISPDCITSLISSHHSFGDSPAPLLTLGLSAIVRSPLSQKNKKASKSPENEPKHGQSREQMSVLEGVRQQLVPNKNRTLGVQDKRNVFQRLSVRLSGWPNLKLLGSGPLNSKDAATNSEISSNSSSLTIVSASTDLELFATQKPDPVLAGLEHASNNVGANGTQFSRVSRRMEEFEQVVLSLPHSPMASALVLSTPINPFDPAWRPVESRVRMHARLHGTVEVSGIVGVDASGQETLKNGLELRHISPVEKSDLLESGVYAREAKMDPIEAVGQSKVPKSGKVRSTSTHGNSIVAVTATAYLRRALSGKTIILHEPGSITLYHLFLKFKARQLNLAVFTHNRSATASITPKCKRAIAGFTLVQTTPPSDDAFPYAESLEQVPVLAAPSKVTTEPPAALSEKQTVAANTSVALQESIPFFTTIPRVLSIEELLPQYRVIKQLMKGGQSDAVYLVVGGSSGDRKLVVKVGKTDSTVSSSTVWGPDGSAETAGTSVFQDLGHETDSAMNQEDKAGWILRGLPNLVSVNQVVSVKGDPTKYIIMDHAGEMNYTQWCEHMGDVARKSGMLRRNERLRLAEAEILRVKRQLASALLALHRHGLVHLDIKPQNVVVQRDADGHWTATIIDLGLVKAVNDKGLVDVRSLTIAFSPPESLDTNGVGLVQGVKVDAYQLGLLFADGDHAFHVGGGGMRFHMARDGSARLLLHSDGQVSNLSKQIPRAMRHLVGLLCEELPQLRVDMTEAIRIIDMALARVTGGGPPLTDTVAQPRHIIHAPTSPIGQAAVSEIAKTWRIDPVQLRLAIQGAVVTNSTHQSASGRGTLSTTADISEPRTSPADNNTETFERAVVNLYGLACRRISEDVASGYVFGAGGSYLEDADKTEGSTTTNDARSQVARTDSPLSRVFPKYGCFQAMTGRLEAHQHVFAVDLETGDEVVIESVFTDCRDTDAWRVGVQLQSQFSGNGDVAPVRDIVRTDGTLEYVVTDYTGDVDYSRWCANLGLHRRRGLLSAEEAITRLTAVNQQVAQMVGNLNGNNVAFGRIKGSDIYMRRTSSPLDVRPIFERMSEAQTMDLLGHVAYAGIFGEVDMIRAPERDVDTSRVSGLKHDTFGLGVLFAQGFRLALGTEAELSSPRVGYKNGRMTGFPSTLPNGLKKLVQDMTSTDPSARPDAAGVASALGDWLAVTVMHSQKQRQSVFRGLQTKAVKKLCSVGGRLFGRKRNDATGIGISARW